MSDSPGVTTSEVVIPAHGVAIGGVLSRPAGNQRGLVIFAHGSGSGRFSPRNNAVARVLQEAGLATLLVDLLTDAESRDRRPVFDIPLLAQRLLACTAWAAVEQGAAPPAIGYFGASTGAGAALLAAAQLDTTIGAVVSRGGRPDLAGDSLRRVRSPTLLIVGGEDLPVIPLNEQALALIPAPKELILVPGATHLFEEPGTLEEVARLARDWFPRYLQSQDAP